MDYKYDAFISYNHNPRDLKITKELQQSLEHYKIPADVQSRTGKKKIERVFLDKGELEVAGDLNEEILRALRNTDNLIVICSPESHESIWVKKEIEYFLQFSDKSHIFTVITAGEPNEVLPDVVKYKEVTDEDGTVRKVPAEPLSCDFRLPQKEARRTELPRLVAAIIGCRYDDLVQRHKQYRQKIITRIAAGAAAVMTLAAGYMIWSNHRLQVSYNNTLIEESQTLTLQSEAALSVGNRIDAVRYAVSALPSAEKERPMVHEAVNALAKALNMYTPPGKNRDVSIRQYKGVVKGSTLEEAGVRSIVPFTIGGERCLAAVYDRGYVCFWSAESGEQILTEITDRLADDDIRADDVYSDNNGHLVVAESNSYICCDSATGKEMWRTDAGKSYFGNMCGACFADSVFWCVTETDDFGDGDNLIVGIDVSTGKKLYSFKKNGSPDHVCAVPGSKSVVCSFTETGEDGITANEDVVYLFRPEEKDSIELCSLAAVTDIQISADGRILVAGYSKLPESESATGPTAAIWHETRYISIFNSYEKKECVISCFDPNNGSSIWSTDIKGVFNSRPWIGTPGEPQAQKGKIDCTIGSSLFYLDKDGKVVNSYDFGNTIMSYYEHPDDEWLNAVLIDGSSCRYDLKENSKTIHFGIFSGILAGAAFDSKSEFVVGMDITGSAMKNRIIEYEYGSFDPKWEDYDFPLPDKNMNISKVIAVPYGDDFILAAEAFYSEGKNSNGGTDTWIIRKCDSVSGEKDGKEVLIEESAYENAVYAGAEAENGILYFIGGDDNDKLIAADTNTGEFSRTDLKFSGEEDTDVYLSSMLETAVTGSQDKRIAAVLSETDYSSETEVETVRLINIDPESGEMRAADLFSFERKGETSEINGLLVGADEEGTGLWTCVRSDLREFDIETGEEKSSAELDFEPEAIAPYKDGIVYALEHIDSTYTVHVLDGKSGKEKACADIGDLEVFDMFRAQEMPDGSVMLVSDIDAVVIDAETGALKSTIPGFYGFNPKTGTVCMDGEAGKFGHVPYRTVEDMIAEAKELIGE